MRRARWGANKLGANLGLYHAHGLEVGEADCIQTLLSRHEEPLEDLK